MSKRTVQVAAWLLALLIMGACSPVKHESNPTRVADRSHEASRLDHETGHAASIPAGGGNGASESDEDASAPDKDPDVVYVPTPQDVVDMMLHLARVSKQDVVYDLGCGDGRVVVTAAKRYGCKAVGYDIDPERVKEARENVRRSGVERLARIVRKDIFTLDLGAANVIFLYLLPELNVQLIPQLEKLRPGSRIISHEFDMKGIRPDAVLKMDSPEDGDEHTVYLWTTPLKREPVDDTKEEEADPPDEEDP